MKKELPIAYTPKDHEDQIYQAWEESGKFNPDNYDLDENSGYFSMVLPPPNVTGVLHLGHASTIAYEDLMIRYNRLLGKRTVWIPGTDHASIATQTKVEKVVLEKEGKTRHDYGREEFLKKVEEFAAASKATIQNQVRRMGASCDWSREKYTLDADVSDGVREVFVRMYRDGLIYRGDRIVNWCPKDLSTLADDEVNYVTQNAKLYTFKYSKDFPSSISTTRPETKLADTGVAVHPTDERYKEFVGKTYEVDFAGGVKLKIKVFADHRVDSAFGTGAVGVTPAHSAIDWQFAQEHDLPIIKLIKEDGLINENGGEFSGLTVAEARKGVVAWLKENELLEDEKDISNNLSVCYRCDTPIEPLPSLQWFINVNKKVKFPDGQEESIKERCIRVVREGKIKFIPERFTKTYFDWMENLRDWCISRQIWFGHRVPVWYKGDEIFVGHEEPQGDGPASAEATAGEGWVMDSDTLDTWFSSGMWTFTTLGWPLNVRQDTVAEHYLEKNDLERFHPTSVLETGYDIIFFWVARMIIMTEYALGEVPFETVYLHGMVRDEKGQKMSKSKGNSIDPLDMIAKFGTDALRLALVIGSTPGNDIKISEPKIEGNRNFVNKLYNISRYIFMTVDEVHRVDHEPEAKTLADEWILNELRKVSFEVTKKLENYEFSQAGETLRAFTWDTLADWYLEIAKIEGGKDEMLLYILERILILWHPFIPYVTEHIWESYNTGEFLMTQRWPIIIPEDIKEVEFDLIQQVITTIRNLRSENKIEPVLKLNCLIVSQYDKQIKKQEEIIKRLGRLENLEIVEQVKDRPKQSAGGVFGEGNMIYLLLEGIIDVEKEMARLEKEIDKTYKEMMAVSVRLDNEAFVKTAPVEIVEAAKAQFSQAQDKLEKLKTQLESLK